MRFQIDLHLSFGKGDDEQQERNEDATGYLASSDETTTGLGFIGPGPKLDEAWEDKA